MYGVGEWSVESLLLTPYALGGSKGKSLIVSLKLIEQEPSNQTKLIRKQDRDRGSRPCPNRGPGPR